MSIYLLLILLETARCKNARFPYDQQIDKNNFLKKDLAFEHIVGDARAYDYSGYADQTLDQDEQVEPNTPRARELGFEGSKGPREMIMPTAVHLVFHDM